VKGSGAGGGSGKKKRLKRIYHSEATAKHAADSVSKKMARAAAEFEIELALGRPDLFPERPIGVSGFKPEIDAKSWLVSETEHTLAGDAGLLTRLKLEAKG
jgi:phage protein D